MSRPLLATAFATLALAACVDNNADSGLTLLRNLAPATGCVVSPDSTDFRPSGIIQTNASSGYLLTPVARNDLALADGESEGQKIVFIEGAHVTVDFYDKELFTAEERAAFTDSGLTRFAVPTSGAIDPDGGTATFTFEVVPRDLLAMIAARLGEQPSTLLDLGVELYGTRSGSSIESNRLRYPVQVCVDCLLSDVGRCANLPTSYTAQTGGVCNARQDGVTDCCLDDGDNMVCPARPPTTPET